VERKYLEMGVPNGQPYSVSGKLEPIKGVSVRVPLCLDLATIDSTEKFSGTPGGGGIGLAMDAYVDLKVLPSPEWNIDIEPTRPVEHVCKAIGEILSYAGAFTVGTVDDAEVPFDAAPEIITAAAVGVNAALGRPIGQRDLRRIISNNMTMEAGGLLELVPDTGVRVAGSLFGGLIILTDEMEIACRTPISEEQTIMLIYPREEGTPADFDKMVQIDKKDREKKALEVLMKLMPAAIKADFDKMGDSIYRLQLLGSKVVEIRRFSGGKEIYRLMSMLRVKGATIIGVHDDTGIISACVSPDRLPDCLEMVGEAGLESVQLKADNKGAKIALSK
jgi:predicted sugar kinase